MEYKMEYTIVQEDNIDKLIEEINNLLSKGWQAQGGVTLDRDDWFYQALTRVKAK